ncbi:hypothetical protein F5148DRAFT_1149859 [Russula earlei]|uniref:Uncharacterized protein n=1 Tax=Russula earlei TaxID=71964 RepID=A0ACC0U7Y8_9AGAM|nr:hypothetical protein F5148DRAFT_1149859 [Russula earlei]
MHSSTVFAILCFALGVTPSFAVHLEKDHHNIRVGPRLWPDHPPRYFNGEKVDIPYEPQPWSQSEYSGPMVPQTLLATDPHASVGAPKSPKNDEPVDIQVLSGNASPPNPDIFIFIAVPSMIRRKHVRGRASSNSKGADNPGNVARHLPHRRTRWSENKGAVSSEDSWGSYTGRD